MIVRTLEEIKGSEREVQAQSGNWISRRFVRNDNDEHYLRGFTDMRLICAFCPPIIGRERHGKDGAYLPHPQQDKYDLARRS